MPRSASRPGDPTALLRLMWQPDTRVGRTGLTVAAIVDAAIGIADHQGLPALTMRRLADEVGVGAMTLYGYVPGRSELIELMLDRVSARTYDGHPAPGDLNGWRAGMEQVARRTYDQGLEHPWLTEIPTARPVLGPGECQRYELELTPLDRIGLSDVEMDQVRSAVTGLAQQAAQWQVGLDRVRRETALSDQQWWEQHEPVLAEAMGSLDLPISSRVGETMSSAGDPPAMLATGVRLLLDGLAAQLDPARHRAARGRSGA